ncbi:MAG: selenocysteine-specific translation elongation factor, partial [Myxococcota bacterium]
SEARVESRGLVLGTAGHIDHGKTALIRALTGVDTDRLPEEKARGITIDLGFAALDLPGVGRLSVVDVPGHEGLVRTMVSGATGIDLLLLVVAADESVMPQTREHVAICHLLGVERGVVALTKTDLADEEMVELCREEVSDLLAGTGLRDAAIVGVSSETGEGVEALRTALAEAVARARPRTPRSGPPRLGIDRIFAMRGFGTVVTGTLVGASLERGQAVEIHPSGLSARVRGLQTHGHDAETVAPGARCAVNLQSVELADLHRGDLITPPKSLLTTQRADVHLHWLSNAPRREGITAVELLVSTAERRARLAGIPRDHFAPGESGFARLHVDGPPLALLPGDRFIVRGFSKSQGAGATLGGGVVLDAHPPQRRRSDPKLLTELETLRRAEPRDAVGERVRRTGFAGLDQERLVLETGLSRQDAQRLLGELEESGEVLAAGRGYWLDANVVSRLETRLEESLSTFHRAQPMRPGMQRASLLGKLPPNVPASAAEFALERLARAHEIATEGDVVRLAGHSAQLDAEAEASTSRIVEEARHAGFEPPSPRDWAKTLGLSLERFRDLVAHLEREGQLVRAPGDLWFAREAIDDLRGRVTQHLEAHGELDTQTYKSLIGTSRRTAMPLMELLDELHVTRRQGDARVLRAGGDR